MARNSALESWKLNSFSTRALLVVAQLLALVSFILALEFLRQTTGGTLFLFSTIAPLLTVLAIAAVAGVAVYRYGRRHSLFIIENVEPGQIIFKQGEEGDCAYFIQSGEVDVMRQEDGVQRVFAKLSKGQYFGEMALISEAPRNATVRAVTPTRLAVLGKQNFLTMLKLMPHTQEDVMKTVSSRAMTISEE